MQQINVMHVTDTLDAGGAERMAVNLANLLPRGRYRAHLCTTRREGVLEDHIAADVSRLQLARRGRFDMKALGMLAKYNSQQGIDVLHAHGTSLFISALASLLPPYPAVVWHDHYGRYRFDDRPTRLYRLASRRVKGVIAVNEPLAVWAQERLSVPAGLVRYIPNFVLTSHSEEPTPPLPGTRESRIVCVANFRPEKDHLTLIRAMTLVLHSCPEAHLLLVGAPVDPDYLARVRDQIRLAGLTEDISILGPRADVPSILKACAVGVLSSASEGLPLSLLEYGEAGLPAVATQVGQCAEVLDGGRAGCLVSPDEPDQLAAALIELLRSPERRRQLGLQFHQRVMEFYSPETALHRVCELYEEIVQLPVESRNATIADGDQLCPKARAELS